jgi:DNA-directed RNA polymerase specialized sigma24 family protein
MTSTPSAGSVTQWLGQLKAGDRAAAQKLWQTYFQRLVSLARRKLLGAPYCRVAGAEDVALSAFDSFYRAAEQGRFPRLDDRDDLWQLLVLIAERKVCDLKKYERRDKRGGGKVLDEAALAGADGDSAAPGLDQAIGREPDPALAAQVAETCQRLLNALGDEQLRKVALWKLEGYTNDELAAKLALSRPTVERKLQRIRRLWGKGDRP